LAAADGFRLAVCTVSLGDTITRAAWIIPARTLVEVARSLPSAPGLPVIMSGTAGDNHLHIAMGDVEVISRLVEGQFPDYERIIPQASTTSVIIGTTDFLRATRVASVFARDNSDIVRLECTPPPQDGAPALGSPVRHTGAEYPHPHVAARMTRSFLFNCNPGLRFNSPENALGTLWERLQSRLWKDVPPMQRRRRNSGRAMKLHYRSATIRSSNKGHPANSSSARRKVPDARRRE
jgi:hypothetical protein